MKRRKWELLGAAVLLALICACVAVFAAADGAKDGWLSISIGNENSAFDLQGVHMAVYQLATGDYGDWTMLDDFKDIQAFIRADGSASVDITLSQIRKRIEERKIKPTAKASSDEKGKAEFKSLPHGIYYTEMLSGPDRLTMSPMLLAIPNKTGNVKVRAVAKYEYETPTPGPTNTPVPNHVPVLDPEPGENVIPIEDYEAALGLTNIQMHVGVCFE